MRQYPKRISSFFPKNIKWDKLFFKDNIDINKYDNLFLSGSKLNATKYQIMVQNNKIEEQNYKDIDKIAQNINDYKGNIFGICFGAQLLAYIKGGKLGKLKETEAGYLPHQLTSNGKIDKVFGFLPETFYGAQLQQDYIKELPKKSDILVTRIGRIHGFKINENNSLIYGIQPHPEMSTPNDATFLTKVNSNWLKDELGTKYEKALKIPSNADFELSKIITKFVELVNTLDL